MKKQNRPVCYSRPGGKYRCQSFRSRFGIRPLLFLSFCFFSCFVSFDCGRSGKYDVGFGDGHSQGRNLRGFLSRRSVVDNVISRVCSGRNLQTEGFAVQRVAQGALRDIFDIDQFLHLPVVGQLPGQGTKAGSGVIRGGIGQFLRVCLRGRFFAY